MFSNPLAIYLLPGGSDLTRFAPRTQLYRFLVRRTKSNFNAVILKRLFMSKFFFLKEQAMSKLALV